MTSEERFNAAVRVVKSLPLDGPFQPSAELKLKFYKYFKQATEGKCTKPSPSIFDFVGKLKWNAWKQLGDMSKIAAMDAYVEELISIVETMAYTENVASFMESLDSFPNEELEMALGPALPRFGSPLELTDIDSELTAPSVDSSSDTEYEDPLTDIPETDIRGNVASDGRTQRHVKFSDPVLEERCERVAEMINQLPTDTFGWIEAIGGMRVELESMRDKCQELEDAVIEMRDRTPYRMNKYLLGSTGICTFFLGMLAMRFLYKFQKCRMLN